jgi:CheY-like chemotaxis protein
MHGGTVEARSAGRGQGSEFIVHLPLVRSQNMEPTEGTERMASAPRLSDLDARLRILVVDDNIDAAQSLAKMLEMLGHEPLLAYDGQDAFELALRHRPDVLFLDIGLPRMNGYQVCESLRRAGLWGQQIAAVTGYGQESDRRRSAEAGFDTHLVKPVNQQIIQQVLQNHAVRPRKK